MSEPAVANRSPHSRLRRRRRWIITGAVLILILVGILVRGPAAPTPTAPGAIAFAVLGDAPYYQWEELQYRIVLQDLNAHDLEWVIHVGDIFWRPCSDLRYEQAFADLMRVRHPVIYTPGDNEWTDCWEERVGSYVPLERLSHLRNLFFKEPTRSLGGRRIEVTTQAAQPEFKEFPENIRFLQRAILVVTIHLVGSRNGWSRSTGRTQADDDEIGRRTRAAAAWVRESFAAARQADAIAMVIALHANPGFENAPTDSFRQLYDPFTATLEDEAAAFDRPILLVNGNNHDYFVDRPLTHRVTSRHLDHVERVQVPGSPQVGWVRVEVALGSRVSFRFEPRIVPQWKYW